MKNILITNNSKFSTSKYDILYTDSPYIKEYTHNSYYLDDLLDDKFNDLLSLYQEKGNNLNQSILDIFFPKYNDGFKKFFNVKIFYTVFFIRVYKLLKLKEKYPHSTITIAITKDEIFQINGIAPINRFANLYYWIVDSFKLNGFKLLMEDKILINNDVKDKPIDGIFLRYINIDFKVLRFYIAKKFKLLKDNNKKIYIKRSNSSIREMEPILHKEGFTYIGLPTLYDYDKVSHNNDADKSKLHNIINQIFSNTNSELECLFSKVITEILLSRVNLFLDLENQVCNNISKISKENSSYILTNTLNGFDSLILAKVLQNNGFKIIDVMHGLTQSYMKDDDIGEFEIDAPDMLLCFNKSEKEMFTKRNSSKVIRHISTSQEEKKIKLNSLQRYSVKKMLNQNSDINIFYPSVTYPYNNYISYGYEDSDENIFKFEISMVKILDKANKHAIYKKYPSRCYIDENPIDTIASKSDNIKVINGNYDFRYIRTIGDIFIFTQLGVSSTISWILGANKPTIYLHSDRFKFINEEAKKIVYECFIAINIDDGDWQIQLTNMLNQPYEKLKRIWQDKQKYRDLYDEEWLMGQDMHAGKLGAKYVKEFMDTDNVE